MIALEQARSPSVAGRHCRLIGSDFHAPATVGHRMTDSGVELILPRGRDLTDAEARKLAWGILADLSPDDAAPAPEIVTYQEANRLAVLDVLRAGPASIAVLSGALDWRRRKTERRLRELREDGRVERIDISPHDIRFRRTISGERAA